MLSSSSCRWKVYTVLPTVLHMYVELLSQPYVANRANRRRGREDDKRYATARSDSQEVSFQSATISTIYGFHHRSVVVVVVGIDRRCPRWWAPGASGQGQGAGSAMPLRNVPAGKSDSYLGRKLRGRRFNIRRPSRDWGVEVADIFSFRRWCSRTQSGTKR